MTTINLAKTVDSLLRGADVLLVVAPQARLKSSTLPKIFTGKVRSLLLELAKETMPGDLGKCSSTLTTSKPAKLQLGVLPNSTSRYNSPSRADCIRRVVAAAALSKTKTPRVILILDEAAHVLPAANAVARALPLFSRKSRKSHTAKLQILAVDHKGKPFPDSKLVRDTIKANREAARLVDSPPTEMNPEALAKEAKTLLRGIKHVTITEIRGDALLKAKLGAIHAVGRCAKKAPRLFIAKYRPPNAKGKHVALVGKGITYDTGGLHIKMRGSMETMKADMGGSAATLGAFYVLASSGIRRSITLLLCLAENAIGSNAYKPDDILTMHSGLTVEINNTDAEGRLVLGDGVSYAARKLGAKVIFDAATLTGAQLIATGLLHAAVISNNGNLEEITIEAGKRSGDLTHPLPFAPELYKREFRSPIADMRNSVRNRSNAQASCAAQFIYWHIEDCDVDWCHVDLAGPAFPDKRGTGYGVALLSEAVRNLY